MDKNNSSRKNEGFQSFSDIFQKKERKKAPTYPWQELALRIIRDLGVPGFKRSAIFKVCRDWPANLIERALNDTKELCQSGAGWKYFFKIIDGFDKKNAANISISKKSDTKSTPGPKSFIKK